MQQPTRWTFAGFDIDLTAGTLRKHGQPVRIGRQAFSALALLVARGGELVTREELQKAIWGDRVHVDFEHGLDVCIRQIRTVVGDDAAGNQIVVTCRREGYRLGVPVKRVARASWPSLQGWAAAAAVVAAIATGSLLAPTIMNNPAAHSNEAGFAPTNGVRPHGDLPSEISPSPNPVFFSRTWPTRSIDAYDWYLRGRGYFDRAAGGKPFGTLPYFERAAALDPTFALAQAGLAVAYLDRAAAGLAPAESVREAKRAAQRALALDARLPEAHIALAELSYRVDEDVPNAQREFARAVELDGRNTHVRLRYAAFLQEQRRFDDALEQLRVSAELDPLSLRSSWQKADTLFSAHRYEESLAEAYHTLELDPYHPWSFRNAGRCLEALGKREEAIDAYLKAGRVALGQLGRVYAVVGRRSAARELLTSLTRRPIEETHHNGVAIAYIYTGLGEPGKAAEWLEKAHRDGVRLPFSIRVSPEWEPLRASREFKELLKSIPVAGV